ncbi:MAG: hypothetical protein JO129_04610 [Candidatus Dependentiae bacterium]|nr:hypothetical protein [Candidatus Dependentiae bacterium]
MNKRLYVASFLILICSAQLPAAGIPHRNNQFAMNNFLNSQGIDPVYQGYWIQFDNRAKEQYINFVLQNNANNVSIQQKITEIQSLLRAISDDISSHTGWFYNDPEDQIQIDWLQEHKNVINQRLAELQWQAKSFGEKATLTTAKWATVYLGVVLAAYLALNQFSKITGTEMTLTYGDLAWMPIEQLLSLAQKALIITKDVVTSQPAQQAAAATLSAAQGLAEYGLEAAQTIAIKSAQAAQVGVHKGALAIAELTKPTI